jgi:hypothetical protein
VELEHLLVRPVGHREVAGRVPIKCDAGILPGREAERASVDHLEAYHPDVSRRVIQPDDAAVQPAERMIDHCSLASFRVPVSSLPISRE